jgi:hypothetical protein
MFTATIMFFKLSGENREALYVKGGSRGSEWLGPFPDSQRANYEH